LEPNKTTAKKNGPLTIFSLYESSLHTSTMRPSPLRSLNKFEANGSEKLMRNKLKESKYLKMTFKLLLELQFFAFVSLPLFSLFEVFRLHASKAKKTHFFLLQVKKKFILFSKSLKALSEYERRTLLRAGCWLIPCCFCCPSVILVPFCY
jgi:hypothetical protein